MVKVIRFTANWCQPCKAVSPILDQVKEHFGEQINYSTIDVDHNKTIPEAYGISSIPTIVIEKDGKVIQKIIGAKPLNSYISAIQSSL